MPNVRDILIHLLVLAALSMALFVPLMGRGFMLDDFGHVFVASQESVRFGLTHASGGPYYAPVTWSSFKIDWILWGAHSFAWACTNLLIHIVNTLLVYFLVLHLWQSRMAAWWAALGFALLFPTNVSAIMYVATRAHLIVALFYLATMLATLWFTRTKRSKISVVAVVCFAALSILAKESGITVPAAIAVVIFYEKRSRRLQVPSAPVIAIFAAIFAVLVLYLNLRAHSGAIPINFSGGPISYVLSPAVLYENLLIYGRRTYGLVLLIAVAVAASLRFLGARPGLASLSKYDVLFSLALFLVTIAPFALMRQKTGVYSYLAGISAALLLGALSRSFYDSGTQVRSTFRLVAFAPVILVVAIYIALTIEDSLKWKQLAEINTAVLTQIAVQQPRVIPNTVIILTYSEIDHTNRFSEAFSSWSFRWALRVLYGDRTVDGMVIPQGERYSVSNQSSEIISLASPATHHY